MGAVLQSLNQGWHTLAFVMFMQGFRTHRNPVFDQQAGRGACIFAQNNVCGGKSLYSAWAEITQITNWCGNKCQAEGTRGMTWAASFAMDSRVPVALCIRPVVFGGRTG